MTQVPADAVDASEDQHAFPVGLATRLATLTAALAVVLVLGTTEIALRWSERSRLEDARREALTVGATLSSYLTRVAARGQRDSILEAFTHWARNDISGTNATVYLAHRGQLVTLSAVDSTALADADPLDSAAFATRTDHTVFVRSPEPTWRIALPLGSPRPFGVLDVRVSTQRLATWARVERRRAYALALASALLVAVAVAWLMVRWVGRPLGALGQVMTTTREGAGWGPEAPEMGPREFRTLAQRYNALRAALIQRERESEARGALLALEERTRAVDRLAAMAETSASFAHEVGTPLNTVRGHLQLLRTDVAAAPGAPGQRIDLVLEQLDRVTAIVRDGVDRYVWPTPEPAAVDLSALAQRVLQFLEPSLVAAGVAVLLHTDDDAPVCALCDADMVQQILLNLLKNALEAMGNGGRVTVAVDRQDERACITVSDDGPGLSDAVRSRLFDPFASTKGPDGTGLGLVISRRLARAQRGDLELRPSDRGVVWRLTFPRAPNGTEERR
jgi:two-component system, NtrC family, sensor kinase